MAALLLRLTGLAKEGGTLASQVGFGVAINRSLPRPLFTDCDNPKNCRESARVLRTLALSRLIGCLDIQAAAFRIASRFNSAFLRGILLEGGVAIFLQAYNVFSIASSGKP